MSPRSPLLRATQYGLLFLLACRQTPEDEPLLLEESFEEECDGMACGWAMVVGEPDDAAWISTVHPGEHGLSLEAGATVRKPYDFDARSVQVNMGSLQGVVSARCDPGGQLDIEVLVRDEGGRADAFGGRPSAPDSWGTPVSFSMTGDFALSDGGTAFMVTNPDLEVTSMLLRNSGTAACQIDHLRVDGFTRARRAPPSSCDVD